VCVVLVSLVMLLGKQLALGQTPSCWPKRLQHAAAGPAAAPVFVAPTGGWDEVCHSKPFRVCQQYRTERKAQQDPPISPPTKSASVRLNWADLSSSSVPAMIFFVLKRQPESFVGRCINKVRLSISLVVHLGFPCIMPGCCCGCVYLLARFRS
jgi:hypothetical protein